MNTSKPPRTLRDRDITAQPAARRAVLVRIMATGLTLAAAGGIATARPAAALGGGSLFDPVGNGPAPGGRKPDLADADAADGTRPSRRGAPTAAQQDRLADCDPNDIVGRRPDRGEVSDAVTGRCRR